MLTYEVDGAKMRSWQTFHEYFKAKLNFPDYYGANMDAWIDCMSELCVQPTLLHIQNSRRLKDDHPELLHAILECGAFVNYRMEAAIHTLATYSSKSRMLVTFRS